MNIYDHDKIKKTRINSIEALRFFSIIQLAIWHIDNSIIKAGFVGAEFYFILAGLFLYKNSISNKADSILGYTINKLKKFYFQYFVAWLFVCICYYKYVSETIKGDLLGSLLNVFSELLLIQGVGSFGFGYNTPQWFFSVLIYGGAIIYGLTKYYPKVSIRCIFPLAIILFLGYTFNYGTAFKLETWSTVGMLPFPMIRGMVEISFGVIVGYIYFNYKEIIIKNIRFVNVSSIISLMQYCAIVVMGAEHSSYVFIFIPIILISSLISQSWFYGLFRHSIWAKLGKLSYSIYVIHMILVGLCRHFLHVVCGLEMPIVVLIYVLLLVPSAYLFNKFCKIIYDHIPIKLYLKSA